MAKDNGSLWSLLVWVASSLVVALATLMFLWVNSVQGGVGDNQDEITKMKIRQAVSELRFIHIKDNLKDLKEGMDRLEDRFETKPE